MPIDGPPPTRLEPDALAHDLKLLARARDELANVFVGQSDVVEQLIVCLISSGHALIEGAPGLGKTLLVRTLAEVTGLEYSRIQFTPDLMPADITGTTVLNYGDDGRARTEFQQGPLFGQLVLADEINRATPKTQSALLEAMQERTVTVGGREFKMERPFFVFATQNPLEMEGTYSLPEAQIDRFFFKVVIGYPNADVLEAILTMTTGTEAPSVSRVMVPEDVLRIQQWVREVPIASHVRRAVVDFIRGTLPHLPNSDKRIGRYVRFGISPRGGQALIIAAKAFALLRGRFNVAFDDIRSALLPALRHRFQLNYEGVADGVDADEILVSSFNRYSRTAESD